MQYVGAGVLVGGCVLAGWWTRNDKPRWQRALDKFNESEATRRRIERAELGSQAGREINAAELVVPEYETLDDLYVRFWSDGHFAIDDELP